MHIVALKGNFDRKLLEHARNWLLGLLGLSIYKLSMWRVGPSILQEHFHALVFPWQGFRDFYLERRLFQRPFLDNAPCMIICDAVHEVDMRDGASTLRCTVNDKPSGTKTTSMLEKVDGGLFCSRTEAGMLKLRAWAVKAN